MATSELVFAASLANPLIRKHIRRHVNDVEWKSGLAKQLVDFTLNSIGIDATPEIASIRSFLSNGHYIEEVDNVISYVREYLLITEESKIRSVVESFNAFYQKRQLEAAMSGDIDPVALVNKIKEIKEIKLEALPLITLGEVDIDKIMKEELGDMSVLPSSTQLIYDCTPWHGYLRGQVCMVCAPPGAGKSLFMLNEVINFLEHNYRVYWCAIGDMMNYDFITRASSVIKRVPYNEVCMAPHRYFDSEVRRLTSKLQLTVMPADTINVHDLAEFIETDVAKGTDDDPDVIVIDYDANLSNTQDNMFEEGRIVYNKLSQLSRPRNKRYRLVMVASQPKIQYWSLPELPKECASESSGKQAAIDLMITMGRENQIQGRHAGILTAAKVRRGKEGVKKHYIFSNSGNISEIERDEYTAMKSFDSQSQAPRPNNNPRNQSRY